MKTGSVTTTGCEIKRFIFPLIVITGVLFSRFFTVSGSIVRIPGLPNNILNSVFAVIVSSLQPRSVLCVTKAGALLAFKKNI
jgi:hypothetical protein